jgi:hypothetical protein
MIEVILMNEIMIWKNDERVNLMMEMVISLEMMKNDEIMSLKMKICFEILII